jgi:hypothetical protein
VGRKFVLETVFVDCGNDVEPKRKESDKRLRRGSQNKVKKDSQDEENEE